MDKDIREINNILVNIFNLVEKLEEESIQGSSFENVSITEVHTLKAIGGGRPKTMTHVANVLGISVSTLTTAIGKLVKKDLVVRSKDAVDKRIVRIALTPKGEQILSAHDEFHNEMVSESVKDLSYNEKRKLLDVLGGIDRYLMTKAAGYEKRGELDMSPVQIGVHTLPVPIVQAGMSIGVAGERLASEVAINGGLGLIALTDIGFREPDFAENPLEANKRVIRKQVSGAVKRVRDAKGKGLVGVNIMWSKEFAPEYVKAAVDSGAQVVVTSAGMPGDIPKYCSDKKVALIPTVSSRRGVETIIRSWTRRYNRVPDAFILQLPTAAGLLGFREDQLDFAIQDRNMTIAEVKGTLSSLENCPLIVGGGIFTRKDAELVYGCGADAFLLGSRFVATRECDAPDEYKKLFIDCTAADTVIVRSPMKSVVRVMKNRFSEELVATGRRDYDIFKAVRDAVSGDHEGGLIFCGEDPGRIKKIERVKDIFREFVK